MLMWNPRYCEVKGNELFDCLCEEGVDEVEEIKLVTNEKNLDQNVCVKKEWTR